MRNQKGITLIALVVTIIVLLILAGVTITYVLADGGIFGRAQDTARAADEGALRDYISLAKVDVLAAHYDTSVTTRENGALTADAVKGIIEANIPASAFTSVTVSATADTSGKVTGTVTATGVKSGKVFTYALDTDVVTASDPATST